MPTLRAAPIPTRPPATPESVPRSRPPSTDVCFLPVKRPRRIFSRPHTGQGTVGNGRRRKYWLRLRRPNPVIASEAKQSSLIIRGTKAGLLRRFAPRNDGPTRSPSPSSPHPARNIPHTSQKSDTGGSSLGCSTTRRVVLGLHVARDTRSLPG